MIVIILSSIVLFFASCSKDDNNNQNVNSKERIPIYEGNKIIGYADASEFTTPTNNELKTFYEKGWLSLDEVQNRYIQSCSWSDGVGGSVECNGGECHLAYYTNEDGSESVGIGCYINEHLDHAGAFRPR